MTKTIVPGMRVRVFFPATEKGAVKGEHIVVSVLSVDSTRALWAGCVEEEPNTRCGVHKGEVKSFTFSQIEEVA